MNYRKGSFLSALLQLLDLISNRKHQEIKDFLETPSIRRYGYLFYKGVLAENFIAELLIGNNSWAKTTPMRKDMGIDVIEYTRPGYNPCKCYQVKNQENPLSVSDVNKHIKVFKESEYNKLPYYILSISGFSFDKASIPYPNVYLIDFNYVVELVNSYSKGFNKNPGSTHYLTDIDFIIKFRILLNTINTFGTPDFYKHLPDNHTKWYAEIIKEKNEGKLNIKKLTLMNKIGLFRCNTDYLWNRNFNKVYKTHNRHIDYIWNESFDKVNETYSKYGSTYENIMFHQHKEWIKRQMNRYLSGDLSPDKVKKLDSINLINEWILNI